MCAVVDGVMPAPAPPFLRPTHSRCRLADGCAHRRVRRRVGGESVETLARTRLQLDKFLLLFVSMVGAVFVCTAAAAAEAERAMRG